MHVTWQRRSPEVCSAPRSSWRRRPTAPGNCWLRQNCWRTEIKNPWCSERCWTWSGQTPGSLLAVDCSGGPLLCVHSSYEEMWTVKQNSGPKQNILVWRPVQLLFIIHAELLILSHVFMIFKAITSFLSTETSSSCFFFSLWRKWM